MLVSLNEAGVPQYEIVENVAWDAIECSPATMKLVSDADGCLVGALWHNEVKSSRAAILRLIDAVPDTSLKVFDI